VKRIATIAAVVAALALAGTAAAALVPGTFDPGHLGCVSSTYSHGVLHLVKSCPSSDNAAAYGLITGMNGQTFQSGSFTLASASQCQGGSPRFNVYTTTSGPDNPFFLGCNNVKPIINENGTATYVFTPETLAAGGSGLSWPTGTITQLSVIIDIQGTADVSKITVNGQREVATGQAKTKHACPHNRTRTHDCGLHKGKGH
jgi:hypothetical protein